MPKIRISNNLIRASRLFWLGLGISMGCFGMAFYFIPNNTANLIGPGKLVCIGFLLASAGCFITAIWLHFRGRITFRPSTEL